MHVVARCNNREVNFTALEEFEIGWTSFLACRTGI